MGLYNLDPSAEWMQPHCSAAWGTKITTDALYEVILPSAQSPAGISVSADGKLASDNLF